VSAIWLVVAGVATFIFGQVLLRLGLEPVMELRRLIARIADDLDFYANRMFSDPDAKKTTDVFRKDATELREKCHLVVCYRLFEAFRAIPPRKDVVQASHYLMGQSNFPAKVEEPIWWRDRSGEIKKLLCIKT
jgi:hypothetical protein